MALDRLKSCLFYNFLLALPSTMRKQSFWFGDSHYLGDFWQYLEDETRYKTPYACTKLNVASAKGISAIFHCTIGESLVYEKGDINDPVTSTPSNLACLIKLPAPHHISSILIKRKIVDIFQWFAYTIYYHLRDLLACSGV